MSLSFSLSVFSERKPNALPRYRRLLDRSGATAERETSPVPALYGRPASHGASRAWVPRCSAASTGPCFVDRRTNPQQQCKRTAPPAARVNVRHQEVTLCRQRSCSGVAAFATLLFFPHHSRHAAKKVVLFDASLQGNSDEIEGLSKSKSLLIAQKYRPGSRPRWRSTACQPCRRYRPGTRPPWPRAECRRTRSSQTW